MKICLVVIYFICFAQNLAKQIFFLMLFKILYSAKTFICAQNLAKSHLLILRYCFCEQ